MFKNLGVKTYIYPQPVLIIATYDEFNNPNAMNAAWGGIYDYDKVTISLSEHKTTDNFKKTKAFTIAIADAKHVKACDYVGIVSGNDEPNKIQKAGFTTSKSSFVNAPIINELPLTLECEVVSFEDGTLIGKIINVVAKEEILGEDGLPDLNKFSPITYDPAHHNYVALGKVVGKAFSDGKELK